MKFQLVSVSGLKFDGDAYEVLVPTKSGTIAVFENHMPLISAGAAGVLSVRKKATDRDDAMQQFAVNGGIMEIDGKTLRFLSEEVSEPEDVSEKEAEAALARAQELIKGASSHAALDEARRVLHHSEAKLHIARLKRRKHL
jgi:F-type H+-transporting ATPase subunit epsilon